MADGVQVENLGYFWHFLRLSGSKTSGQQLNCSHALAAVYDAVDWTEVA